jgi:hypothetical protein
MLSSSLNIGLLVSDLAHTISFSREFRPGCQDNAHSLMNADETNSVSSLIDDVTYSVTPYVMTRLMMGTRQVKAPPPRSDWPHEDYFGRGRAPPERVLDLNVQ